MTWLRWCFCCFFWAEALDVAEYYSASGVDCPLPGTGEDSDVTVDVTVQWPTGEALVPRCLLPKDNTNYLPQILDFYPKVGVAGETVLVEILGRRFPHILAAENKSVVECSLGGDGYRAPATLLSDKRVICNVSSHVAGEQKLGLVFAGMLQAYARKLMTFGKVGAPTLQASTIDEEDSEECKDTQVFCQPPPPEPALVEVPTQRSQDVSPAVATSNAQDVDNLYSVWEVVSVVPDTLPIDNSAYVVTFSTPPERGLACRLYPDGEMVFASQLTNVSITCNLAVGAPGSYALQVGEAPDFNFLTLPVGIEVFRQPSLLQISPAQVYPGQVWTLHLLATEFPEQRMTFSSFRCKVGSRLVPGEVSTSRVASCQLSVADVEAIGPGRHFVEVLPDGIHETRSEPQVLLEVYPEKAQIESLSSDLMSLRSRGGLLYVKGQRLPKDADCIFGEDKPLEGLYAVYAAAVYYNETTISCIIPQEAPAGGSVLFRLAAAGQIVDVDHPTSNMRLAIGEQLQNVDPHAGTVFLRERSEILIGGMPAGFGRLSPYDGGGSCALGPPDEHFNHTKEEQSFDPHCAGCGAVCRATPKHLPEVELRMRMSGTAGWPGGAMQLLPSLPALGDLRMTPREAFAEDVQLRFRGEGLQDYVQMFPHRFSCHIGPDLAAPASLVRGDWPLSCHFPDLGAVKGLEVRVQLVFSHAGIQKNLGPAFPLTLRLRPVVSAVSPPLALAQLATPLALQVARLPASAQLRCDFGRFGTSLAIATGSSVHCRAPAISSKTAAGSLQLRVAIEENFRQQIVVMAVEDFRWIAAPADPVVEALPPYTAPLGAAVFLEWKSHAPLFEVLARVPYRCSWRQTEMGDLSTAVLALSPQMARCQVPLASVPHAVAVRLEDPTGQVLVEGPLFRYFAPLRGTWWLPERITTSSVLRFQTNEASYPDMAYGQPLPGVSIHCQYGHVRYPPKSVDVNGVECEIPPIAPGDHLLALLYDGKHVLSSLSLKLDPPHYETPVEELVQPSVPYEPALDAPPPEDPRLLLAASEVQAQPAETAKQIMVKAISPSRGAMSGGTTVRVTIRIPDATDPFALWCVFGKHQPTQAIRGDQDGRAWHNKIEADKASLEISPWMDVLCISPAHAAPESVPFYIARSSEPGEAREGSRLFTYQPTPTMATITPYLVSHHFVMDQQVTIHVGSEDSVHFASLSDALDCALLTLETATTTGDWECLQSGVNSTGTCRNQSVSDVFDAMSSIAASGMRINGYAASTAGVLSKGLALADGSGMAAVSCSIPKQFSPFSSVDLAADPIPTRAATRKTGWQATEAIAPLWLEPGQYPVTQDTEATTTQEIGPPIEQHFDRNLRMAVSFNGPDGDFYTAGSVSSSPFSLPYEVKRRYGWAGGQRVRLMGLAWPEGAELEVSLIFAFEERDVFSDCERSSREAECVVPTPSSTDGMEVALKMRTVLNGEIAFYDLGLTYTYMAVPTVLFSIPARASLDGTTWLEVFGGPFDARVEYFCTFVAPLASHLPKVSEEPARFLNSSTLLCQPPKILLPTMCSLTLSSDREMTNLGIGHAAFEFAEPEVEVASEYREPLLESEQLVPMITALTPLEGQEGWDTDLRLFGENFRAGCRCSFILEEPDEWDASSASFAEATVINSSLMHCTGLDFPSFAVAAFCPPKLSSNYMWLHRPPPTYFVPFSIWPENASFPEVASLAIPSSVRFQSPAYNISTYNPGVRIQRIAPRNYLPFVESQTSQRYFTILHVEGLLPKDDATPSDTGFTPNHCEVRFGDVPAETMVKNSTFVEAIIPEAFTNQTVPLHIFCGEPMQQVTYAQTWMFRYTFLPELFGVSPEEVEAQSHEWLTLHGRFFEDFPGRACLMGNELVLGVKVRVVSSEMVMCRVPLWQQDAPNLTVAFSNDGQFFSKETVILNTWARIRIMAFEPSFVYLGDMANITVLGRNFRSGLQCLFNDYARVEPVLLWHTQLRCIIPPDFLHLGIGNVSLRLIMREDHAREGKYALEEKEFFIALRERPPEPIVPLLRPPDEEEELHSTEFQRYTGKLPPANESGLIPLVPAEEPPGLFWWPSTLSIGNQTTSFSRITISPQRGPLDGIDVILRTDGFYLPPYARCRCRFGDVQVPAYCVARRQQVQCRAPAVTGEQTVLAQFSINDGADWSPGAPFSFYAPPLFAALQPPLGSLLGGNNVSIYVFQFPTDDSVPSFCRWQGTFAVPITIGGPDHITCPVPAHSAFAPFSREGDDMPLTLEVSFAGIPPVWIPLPRSLHFRQHNIPVRKTQELFVAPRHGIASVGGAALTLTGAGFVFPTVNTSLVGCIFGRHFFSPGVVDSSSSMRCRAPALSSIFPDAVPPADVTIDLTFDGGQTRTDLNNIYSYLQDFEFISVLPTGGLFSTQTLASISGRNFKRTPNIFLKFGEVKVSAAATTDTLRAVAPLQPEPGTYPIYYSVDDQTFVDTGLVWIASATSLVTAIIPDRGFRVGGTNVTIVTSGLYWLPSLSCVFGYAPVSTVEVYNPDDPANPRLTCLTPPCEQAMYLDGVGPNSSVDCFGFVTVQMTFNGQNFFGNLTYEYVKMPQVRYASPFPASGWSNDLTIALFGENFQEPMWCRWSDLGESPATDVTPGFMRCTAPQLPWDLRPDNRTADSVLSYFEISPNGQDWTRFKRAWLWYREPEVLSIVPNTTFRTFAPEGDFIVTGRYFRLLQPELVECVWLYDKYLPAERSPAELLAPDVLRCRPTQPAAASGVGTDKLQPLGVNLEVSMSTQVDSASEQTVLAEDRMSLLASSLGNFPGPAVFPTTCLVTGGCTLTLRGNLWAEDFVYGSGNRTGAKLFVAVGDHLLEARRGKDSMWATVRLPPTPHMAAVPRAEPLRLTRNLQDYTPVEFNIGYNPIPMGSFYRPELHNGTLQPCPQGHACPGVGVNQSDLTYPGEAPIRCLPGTWMNATGYFECETCPEGVYCPRYSMIEPEHCETGYICWAGTGYDANLALCPAGKLCVKPAYGKTVSTSSSRFPFVRRLEEERRLRLSALPATEIMDCPAGYFCPPGSVAERDPFTGELIFVSPMTCTRLGIVCSEGSFNPLSVDVVAGPGEYVAPDNSGVLPCPVGMSCPGGPGFLLPQPCPPGQYQLSSGAPDCSTCTAGTICTGFGSALPTLCPAGRVCAHPGREIPSYLCPAGSYCPPGVITLNTLAGISDNGPVVCPPGYYCMAGTASAIVDPTSMDTAKQCTQGTFCVANTTTAGGTDNCPPRWYCPAGVSSPQPTPPGHYVGKSGSIYPSKCRPGTYAANWLMVACDPCPAGTECPLDGTVVPTVCRPGSYREATVAGADPTKNVMCTPCPQGTWSAQGGLTSVLDCKNCNERYVCPMEGTVRFATVDQPCAADALPTDICYENSQGWDCPQGYGCGPATTSFTQYDYYCEAGFWCKVRTIPSETRNLVCPAGYYCKRETGESGGSGRKAFRCPSNHFCPEGTAAQDVRIDNQLLIVLHNVQSLVEIVTLPDMTRGSMCRICSDEQPPGVFDLARCRPCGKIVPLSFFENLAARRLDELENHYVALPENYSNTSKGMQVWILANHTEEPVDLPLDAASPELLARALQQLEEIQLRQQTPDYEAMVAASLEDYEPPVVVGYFAGNGTTNHTPSDPRQLQAAATVTNSSNSSNVTREVVYHCAPDIHTEDLTPWMKSSGLPCYSAVEDWKGNLKCPRGTISTIGSESPEDCIQQGLLIAVTNIYKCYPPRPCNTEFPEDYVCQESEVLCGISEPLELYASDKTYKKSFVWGEPIDPTDPDSKTVQFFGFDPFVDEDLTRKPFHNFELQPMDLAVLDLAFDQISPTTLVNAGEAGHFNIHIHSTLLDPNNAEEIDRGHLLPPFFWRPINTDLHVKTQLKILALERFNMSVQLDLLHGGHVQNLDTFNQVLDIHRFSPTRAIWGTRYFFCSVISKERLLNGAYELPYNMPPGLAGQLGNPGFAIALTKLGGNLENQPQTVQYDGALALAETDKGGQAFWQSQGIDTVPMPWLPFFSNCVGFDSFIVLWDLFESPGELRDGCELVPRDDVKIVPPLIVDLATLEPRLFPVADQCEIITKCHFEENMEEGAYASTLWWELEEDVDLFYITTYPILYSEYKEGDAFFASKVGTEQLTAVGLQSDERNNGRIPRRVYFEMQYFQRSLDDKKLVAVSMQLSEFDDDDTDTVYYLMLKFEALGWQDLMNEFQLPYQVYAILYCLIGLGAVGATLVAWAGIRLKVRKATAPPFRLVECYEFMFWWPVQGVSFATLPVVFACAMIKLLLNPQFNFTGGIPCKYSELASAQTDEKESETCREGRTGTCFLLAGLLMMVSGSRMMIPRLREVEEQFLLQQPTHLLSREGLTLRAEQRQQIRTVPIRWKRAHLIFVSLFLIFPLILLWEFTYCEFFGENALYFIIGFSFAMNFVDNALSKAVREELIQVPLSTACSVVLFIGTLGANDFVDFCEGFFLELLYGIAERLILGSLLEATEKGVAWGVHWAKTRSWFWRLTLLVTGGRSTKALLMNEGKDEDDVSPEEVGMEGTPIEEAMEEVIGCGTTCMSTIMTPFIISAIYFFASETEIPVQYDIRSTDLVCYLLFGVIIAPFQVMMDILMNHATELQNNVRIYDYMLYAKWRWRNRVTRWLFDDPRLDQSIAEPLQSVNHLAFSPQFYFIETYYTWGMLVSLLSITIFLRKNMNPLDDPALFILVGQMFLLNYLLDRLIRWLTSSVLWKPMDNSNFRIFSRSVALALQRKDAALGQEKYRQWFWQRHTGWLVNHLGDIFTPRSRERYKGKLSLLYQQALQLQKTHVYKTPGDAFPEPVGQQELPENLRLELEEDESDDEKSPLALKAGKGGGMLGLTLPGVKQKQESPGKLRASVALRRLDLPSMPQMPLAPLPPTEPEPIEDWPLQLMGEEKDKELQDAAGFGPLAALTGAAWLRVARRRLIMSRQSQEYTHEQPLNDVCGGCAVRANDPFVKERIGVWQHGPRFKVYFVGQLRALMTSFERHYNVPPMPFVPQQWQNWLDRHNAYQTLCVRCALERGLDPPPPQEAQTPSQPTTPKALPAPPTRDREESTDSEEEEALMLMEEQGTPQHDDASDIEFEPAETARFPNLVNVQVSQPAREMIVYWARQARRRLKRRRTIRYQPDTSSESEESSDGNDTPELAD